MQLTWDLNRPRPAPNRRVYGLAIGSGVLTVSGTKLADTVAISATGSELTFTLNSEQFTYPLASIQTIKFEAQATPNSPAGTIIARSLSIPSGMVLDLTNNSMIIDYTGASPAQTVRDLLGSAYAFGAWSGQGLTSSTAGASTFPGKTSLGWLDNNGGQFANFAGQPVDNTSILIKYTYAGDATLDGQVDVADLGVLASYWQSSGEWSEGDFDYTAFVDINDLGILASNWQAGVGGPLFVGGDPDQDFLDGIEKLELSEDEIAKLLEMLGEGGGATL